MDGCDQPSAIMPIRLEPVRGADQAGSVFAPPDRARLLHNSLTRGAEIRHKQAEALAGIPEHPMPARIPSLPAELDFASIRQTLLDAAAAAAAETLPRFRTPLAVENKWASGFDPVTEADKGAESAIRALIGERFADHAIIGEEWGRSGDGRFAWIIDPVDGTRAFISGVPVWGTLIGFAVDGRPVAGVMSQPFTGETFIGIPGGAEYRRGGDVLALRTSGRTELATARLSTTTPSLFRGPGQRLAYDALERNCLQVRYGLDCYAYCLLAAGHLDLVVEVGLQVYDIAALIPIIEEAGGAITAWDGGRPDGGGDVVAAATPELLEAALAVLAAAPGSQ